MRRREFLNAAVAGVATLARRATPPAAAQPRRSPMKVLLWCWDARMTWDDQPEAIARRMASADGAFAYPKRPESFLVGFRFYKFYKARKDGNNRAFLQDDFRPPRVVEEFVKDCLQAFAFPDKKVDFLQHAFLVYFGRGGDLFPHELQVEVYR